MAKDHTYGGFSRTAFSAVSGTVRAGTSTEQKQEKPIQQTIQPKEVSLMIPEWLSTEDKIKYLTYIKDYLQTQLALVENELDALA